MAAEEILVLAPLGRDAEVICSLLQSAGVQSHACRDIFELCERVVAGSGALLVTEEALGAKNRTLLQEALAAQPVWSDLPVTLLLSASRQTPRGWVEVQALLPGQHVTVLRRPVPTATLISVMSAALATRRWQYQVRDHLREREARAEELERRVRERTQVLEETSKQLQTARDLFEALFHANPLPAAITRLRDGLFLDVNEAYLEYFGYKREQVIGHTSRELKVWLPDAEREQLVARLREQGSVRNVELTTAHPAGTSRTALVSVELIELNGITAAISAFVDITERKRAEARIRELASQLTMAEHKERHRISQILHDQVQQQLYSVQIQLMLLRGAVDGTDLLQEIEEIEEGVNSSIEMTRQLSVDLSPAILRGEGLAEGLRWIAGRMKEQYDLTVDVVAEGDESFPVTDDGRRVLLFQIVRELLFNAVKHAGVSQVLIRLWRTAEGEGYWLEVRDEGGGFDPEEALDVPGGQGLLYARERLRLIGGEMEVESTPGAGTRVQLFLPLVGEAEVA